ncbi:uncharacterized protein LOC116179824 isoform X1 [Photinus pyralis]|uniref:DUF4806 domain-containing protein n=1 Tax=Photinus pyralis TaxID=7054 RepID=A0A1Y1MD81_PHOPY|nr:uncharacterized protein LOC116179004 isoform X1 [Photinus pyralis]XP_031355537.1 uncharacterized protein LOC116179824 isoform X1 [Photinus pyralis]
MCLHFTLLIFLFTCHNHQSFKMPNWKIVKFIKDCTIEAVPCTWILAEDNSLCYWPPATYTTESLTVALKNHDEPEDNWPLYKICHYVNNTYESYSLAVSKRLKAKKNNNIENLASDSDTTSKKKRKHVMKRVLSSSDDDSDERVVNSRVSCLPMPPKKNARKNGSDTNVCNHVNDEVEEVDAPRPITNIDTPQRPPKDQNKNGNTLGAGVSDVNYCEECSLCPRHRQRGNDAEAGLKMQKEILRQQRLIKGMIMDVVEELHSIKNKNNSTTEVTTNSIFSQLTLPANDPNDLVALEDYLSEESNFKAAVHEMSNVGGNNLYEFAKRIVSSFMTDKIATNYTYYGLRNKQNFSKLRLCALILDARKMNKQFGNASVKEVEECVMKWLRRSKERSEFKLKKNNMNDM